MHPVTKVKLINVELFTFGVEVHFAVASQQLHFDCIVGDLVDDSLAVKKHFVVNTQYSMEHMVFSNGVYAVDASEDVTILFHVQGQFHVVGVAARLREIDIFARQLDRHIIFQYGWLSIYEQFYHLFRNL